MGRGAMFYFHNFPKKQLPIRPSKVRFWKEFRLSQQQRAKALKAAVERYRAKRNHVRDNN